MWAAIGTLQGYILAPMGRIMELLDVISALWGAILGALGIHFERPGARRPLFFDLEAILQKI